jgi:methyl-accepting chemotaxis protein
MARGFLNSAPVGAIAGAATGATHHGIRQGKAFVKSHSRQTKNMMRNVSEAASGWKATARSTSDNLKRTADSVERVSDVITNASEKAKNYKGKGIKGGIIRRAFDRMGLRKGD